MINSLQKIKTKNKKKRKQSKNPEKNINKSSKINTSVYNSRRSSKSQNKLKSPDILSRSNKGPKAKSKKNSKLLPNVEKKKKKNSKKPKLNFYESEKIKKNQTNIGSTQIKTEAESVLQKYEDSQQLDEFFAPLSIKRTHIDSGRNTGLLCKICLEAANKNIKMGKGVEIPQCKTENCVNNQNTKKVHVGVDERLDKAFEESLLNMESEIIEKHFGNGLEDNEDSINDFEFKESSIINEEISKMGSKKDPPGINSMPDFNLEDTNSIEQLDTDFLESTLKLNPSDSKYTNHNQSSNILKSIEEFVPSPNPFVKPNESESENNEILIKENMNFGMLLSNEELQDYPDMTKEISTGMKKNKSVKKLKKNVINKSNRDKTTKDTVRGKDTKKLKSVKTVDKLVPLDDIKTVKAKNTINQKY